MAINVGTLVTQLTVDASGVRRGTVEAKSALGGWVEEQKKLQQSANETRDVLKRAFAAETLVASLGNVSNALKETKSQFAGHVADMIGNVSRIGQGFMQGGPLGAGLAAASIGVSELVEHFSRVQRAADAAMARAKDGLTSATAEAKKAQEQLASVRAQMEAIQAAGATGGSVTSEALGIRADQLMSQIKKAQIADEAKQSQMLGTNLRAKGGSDQFLRLGVERDALAQEIKTAEANLQAVGEQMAIEYRAIRAAALGDRFKKLSDDLSQGRGGSLADFNASLKLAKDSIDPKAFEDMTRSSRDLAQSLAAQRATAERTVYYAQQAYDIKQFAKASEVPVSEIRADREARQARDAAAAEERRLAARDEELRRIEHSNKVRDEEERNAREFSERIAEAAAAARDWEDKLARMTPTMRAFEEARTLANALGESGTVAGVQAAALANTGPKTQAVGGAVARAVSGDFLGAAVELVSQSKQFQAIMGKVEEVASLIVDAFGAVLEPLAPIIDVVGALAKSVLPSLGVVFDLLKPAFQVLFYIVKGVAIGLTAIVTAIDYAFKSGVNGVLELLGSIAGLFSDDAKAWIDSFKYDIPPTLGAAVEAATKDLVDLDFNTSLDDFKNNVKDVNREMSEMQVNLPAAMRVSLARFNATRDGTEDAGGSSGSGKRKRMKAGGAAAAPDGGESIAIYGPITVVANDPRSFAEAFKAYARKQQLIDNGAAA